MPNRWWSTIAERKTGRSGTGNSMERPGKKKGAPDVAEKTANWPTPGPTWAGSFNRETKVPVVKTRAKKHGID